PSPLADLPIQYADFAVWQRDRLQGDVLEGLRRYWREQLNGLPTLELPIDRPRPQVRTTFGAHCERQLSSQLSHAVRQLRNAEGATTFMTLLAAFQLLLHRYSGQDDFAIGTPVAGRLRPETEGLIGYFINDLVLRADVSGDPSFRQLLGRARETVLQAFSHQELPFMHLVRELNPARSPNRHPLIQVELVLQNTPSASKDLPGIEWGEVGSETRAGAADLDLSMIAREDEQGIHLLLSYRTDLFDEATIRLMLEHMQALLEAVVADPDQRLSQLLSQALPQLPDRRSSRKSSPARASSAKAKTPYVAPRTDMERELAAIWEGILKVDRVGVHDDFFELGGYSLLAVQVMARACTLLNRELPFAVIFASPTVATLAERVEAARHCESSRAPEEGPVVAEVASDSFRPTTGNRQSLVPLRSGASTTPVFCIHGLGGHVAGFLSLASSLTEARPVYGLQGQGLEAGQQPHDRIEAMAASYLNEIRRVQPRGPYLLVGWSMGGLIAMEAAQQLAAIREHVALVAMLDTYLSIPNDANLDPDDQSVIRWIAPQLNLCARELKELPLDRQWERIAEQAELAQGDGVADIRRLAAVCKAHLAAAARYQPQPYLGRAVLLQADAGRVGLERCWKELCPRLSVERVPGNHYSMLRKPQVDEVVKRLSRYLADAVHVDALVTNR
ncbi:MAG: alpha/beta fold hydrolase, partial [Planctomycetaceae bacterium]